LPPTESPQAPTRDINAVFMVPKDWLSYTEPGQRIKFRDARGKARSFKVSMVVNESRLAESEQTSYVISETMLHIITSLLAALRIDSWKGNKSVIVFGFCVAG